MTASTTKIVGQFVYQVDQIRPRHRNPERLNVLAPAEYEIATISKAELVPDAVVFRMVKDGDRAKLGRKISLAAWNGALWSPLGNDSDDLNAIEHPAITVTEYQARMADWLDHAGAYAKSDPLRRAFARTASPAEQTQYYDYPRASTFGDKKKLTYREADLHGITEWSNRGEALARHNRNSQHLLIVDGAIYTRRPDPVWSVNKERGTAILTVPTYIWSSAGAYMPYDHCRGDLGSARVFRMDRMEEAAALGVPLRGEIISMDASLLTRDDVAWTLFCKLDYLVTQTERFARHMSPEALAAWKTISDISLTADIYDMSPVSDRKAEILRGLFTLRHSLASMECPYREIGWRDGMISWIRSLERRCSPAVEQERTLAPEDLAGVADLAGGVQP